MSPRFYSENFDIVGDPGVPIHFRRRSQVRYEFTLSHAAGKKVLDLGCGYGYGAAMLAETAQSVTGVDRNGHALSLAKNRYSHLGNLQFVQANALDFLKETSSTFDLVVLFEVLEHIQAQEELLHGICRVTKEGARLFLSTPNRTRTPFYRKNPYHVQELSVEETRELVGKWFAIDLLKGQTPGIWAILPQYFIAPLTSRLGIYGRIVRLNDRPENSMTVILAGLRKANAGPYPGMALSQVGEPGLA